MEKKTYLRNVFFWSLHYYILVGTNFRKIQNEIRPQFCNKYKYGKSFLVSSILLRFIFEKLILTVENLLYLFRNSIH